MATVTSTEVSLQDRIWQLFTEPEEFTMLNFDTESFKQSGASTLPTDKPNYYSLVIERNALKKIQKRVVYDLLTMFGDIGGIQDFIYLTFSFLVGTFNAKSFDIRKVQTLFRFG